MVKSKKKAEKEDEKKIVLENDNKEEISENKKVSKKEKPKTDKKKGEDLIERIITGIPNFDTLIEGGFPKDSTNLIIGSSGSAKSIFATEFLVSGMDQGEKCLYITFEEKKDGFYQNMKRFGWDLKKYEKDDKFHFIEYTPTKINTMLEEGGGEIETIILEKKISRVVIDSITSFALLFEDELAKREAALSLFSMISKWNCTSLLTVEEEPDDLRSNTSKTLEFEADSVVLLYYIREDDIRKRYIEVLKMRGTKHSRRIYEFSVENSGIKVENKPTQKRVFVE